MHTETHAYPGALKLRSLAPASDAPATMMATAHNRVVDGTFLNAKYSPVTTTTVVARRKTPNMGTVRYFNAINPDCTYSIHIRASGMTCRAEDKERGPPKSITPSFPRASEKKMERPP